MSGADQRKRRPPTWTRIYSFGFAAALVALTGWLIVRAATAAPDERSRAIGEAFFVGAFTGALVLLLWGVDRRWRAMGDDASDHPR